MAGRYSVDQLTVALLVFGLLISFSLSIAGLFPWYLLSWIPYGFAIYRMLSRRTDARRRRTRLFESLGTGGRLVPAAQEAFRNRKAYRYFRCPHCRAAPAHRAAGEDSDYLPALPREIYPEDLNAARQRGLHSETVLLGREML